MNEELRNKFLQKGDAVLKGGVVSHAPKSTSSESMKKTTDLVKTVPLPSISLELRNKFLQKGDAVLKGGVVSHEPKSTSSDDRIKKINIANSLLKDPAERELYDKNLRNQEAKAKEYPDTNKYQGSIYESPISHTPIKYRIFGLIGILWAVSMVLHGGVTNNSSFAYKLGDLFAVCIILLPSLYYVSNKSKEFVLLYAVSFIVASPFVWYFGYYSSKGYMFNLTRAMIWPYIMFESSPTV